jgi:NitT/TauT family transport system substrate-binding protein
MRKTLFIIILLTLTYGCKRSAVNTTPSKTITIGVLPTMDFLPFAIANQNGTYDSLGLAVNFKMFHSEEEMCLAFHRQNIEGMLTDIPDAIIQQNNYNNGQVIMQTDGYYQLIAKNEMQSIANLKNKNVSISHNTAVDFLTGIVLQNKKINLYVNEPEINKIPIRLTTLIDNKSNSISASFLPDVSATKALHAGGMKALRNSDSIGLHLNVMMINKSTIGNKGREIKDLIIGYNIAANYINANKHKIWKSTILYPLNIDKATAKHIKVPTYENATLPEKRTIRLCRIWLKTRHLLNNKYDINKFVNYEFAIKNNNHRKKFNL